jgi:hypothetical protein
MILISLLSLAWGAEPAAPSDLPTGADVATAGGPIVVDGVLDEPGWALAVPVTSFLRFQPTDGDAPPGRTEVRFLQDDRFLYVGATVRDAGYPIRGRIARREDVNADDQIGIYLDTFRDGRSGYIFYINARGVQQDIRVGPGFGSVAWDTVFKTHGVLTPEGDGFTLEVAIPWRSLKFPRPEGPQDWGLMLTRKIPSEGAKYGFPKLQRAHPRMFTQAATLHGVAPPRRGSGLELIPSLTVVQQATRGDDDTLRWVDLDPSHPEAGKNWLKVVRPSLDARLGLTSDIGLAATINPDFSQVDQDPTFIDLNQQFNLILPERRPFFLDGIDGFDDQHTTLYTRSVVDPAYGLKVSGREGTVALGVLHALDRSPTQTVHERETPGFEQEDVEGAWALNNLARARLDAFGQGYVGATFADKRILGPGGALRGVHTSGGADVRVPVGERWTIDGQTSHSWTGRSPSDLRWGQALGASVTRSDGPGARVALGLSDTTLGYRQELGFRNQSGITQANAGGGWQFEPAGAIDTFTPRADLVVRQERNGERRRRVEGSLNLQHHGIHTWGAWGGVSEIVEGREEDAEGQILDPARFTGPYGGIFYNAELSRLLALTSEARFSRSLEFSTLEPANLWVSSTGITLRPTPGLRLDTTVRVDQLARPAGPAATATLIRHWTTWQFTKELGLRSMIEHAAGNERDDRLTTTLLLTWLENPWTAVHLGWIERTELDGGAKTQDRSVFVKLSALFRP